jgi:hypothetical protein
MPHARGVIEHQHVAAPCPTRAKTSVSPWHTHSASRPATPHIAHVRIRERDHQEMHHAPRPATTALAWPKSTCAVPGAHASSRVPLRLARDARLPPSLHPPLHRRIRAREPVLVATRPLHTPAWRYAAACAASRRSAVSQPSTIIGIPRINQRPAPPARPGGLGEKSSLPAYLTTVVRDTAARARSPYASAQLLPSCLIRC